MEEKKKRTNWKEEAQRAILNGKFTNKELQEFVEGKKEETVSDYSDIEYRVRYETTKEIVVNMLYKMEENEIQRICHAATVKCRKMKERAEKIKAARNK